MTDKYRLAVTEGHPLPFNRAFRQSYQTMKHYGNHDTILVIVITFQFWTFTDFFS
jgi:hypothetical protein